MKFTSSEKIIVASIITIIIVSFAIALSGLLWIGLYALLCYFIDYEFTWSKAFAFWGIGILMITIFKSLLRK